MIGGSRTTSFHQPCTNIPKAIVKCIQCFALHKKILANILLAPGVIHKSKRAYPFGVPTNPS